MKVNAYNSKTTMLRNMKYKPHERVYHQDFFGTIHTNILDIMLDFKTKFLKQKFTASCRKIMNSASSLLNGTY